MESYVTALSFLSGILCHHTIWIRGEWDEVFWIFLDSAIVVHHIVAYFWACVANVDFIATYLFLLWLELLHVVGTFLSIGIYRAYFHPLHHFPGPFWARVSMWWRMKSIWQTGHRHAVQLDDLHRQYGDVVRIAPNQLSINSASSIPLIHGSGSYSVLDKGANYLNPANGGSVNADRDPVRHRLRRIKWDRALSSKAIPDYTAGISNLVSKLLERLSVHNEAPVEVNDELHLFTLDVIGSIGFGLDHGFEQLDSGVLNPVIRHISEMMRMGVYMMTLPWLHCLLGAIPSFGIIYKPDEVFRGFAQWALNLRLQNEDLKHDGDTKSETRPDIMTYLLQPLPESRKEEDVKLTHHQLTSDALILTLGGSDTTTSASVHALYRLARHPEIQKTLFASITSLDSGITDRQHLLPAPQISKLTYLEAFISEILRLHPPAVTGLPRVVPASGLTLEDGTYIPPQTNVSSPVYSLHHDPRFFPSPLLFLPERWLSHTAVVPEGMIPRPEMVGDKRAFMAFGTGPYGCPGRKLAYVEMKILLANLIRRFEVRFPEGVDVLEVDRMVESGWRDYSTVQAARLDIRFVERWGR